ncbi:MAG: tetratricopeptide repeat protein [Bdellovibrionaceae bacterium]|nr:tetratricopeptide repeat protein [Pseudobdellovibrionaceae bacterium]MDW8191266.1 tetratricopeptide repeat protein [Pseudobdellovibrionaceae bacterium]
MMKRNAAFFISIFLVTVTFFLFGISFERQYGSDYSIRLALDRAHKVIMQKELQIALKDFQISTLRGNKVDRVPASQRELSFAVKARRLLSQLRVSRRQNDCVNVVEIAKKIEADYSFLPEFPEVLFLKGDCLILLQQVGQALEVYNSLIDLYPDHAVTGYALLKMAEILISQKKHDEAREVLGVLQRVFRHDHSLLKSSNDLLLSLDSNL